MMVLVDSSIWIGYFSKGLYAGLSDLIMDDLVVINDVILCELVPYLSVAGQHKTIKYLKAIKFVELDIHWPSLRELQKLNLNNGINKVGIPDLIIAQHALRNGFELWSNDKHFKLMSSFINLKMFV